MRYRAKLPPYKKRRRSVWCELSSDNEHVVVADKPFAWAVGESIVSIIIWLEKIHGELYVIDDYGYEHRIV